MRRLRVIVASLVVLLVTPAIVRAQASIAGQVKDASGAVLPGVTVEASSPALIEQIRTVVTGSTGQYRIELLPPGTYTVNVRARRVQHGETGRRSTDRNAHRDDRHGASCWRAAGNDY